MNAEQDLPFLRRCLPAYFVRRVTVIAPGHELIYDQADWHDAIVVVARGQIELEGHSRRRTGVQRGAVLWLQGLPLRALHNSGTESAVLVAVSRPVSGA